MNISALRSPLSARKGFTLIEILIVVGIIGLLASIVLVGLAPAQRRGRDARRLADLKQVQNALELYYNKCGYYPGTAQLDTPCASNPAAISSWSDLTSALTGSSLGVNQIPNDPSAGGTYYYATNSGNTAYTLAAKLEDANNPVLKQALPATAPVPASVTCDGKGQYYCTTF